MFAGGSPGVIISCDRCSVEPRFQKLITLKFPDTTKEGDTWKFEVQRSKETAGIYTCQGLRGAASFHSTPCNITDTPEEHLLSSSTTTDAPAGRLIFAELVFINLEKNKYILEVPVFVMMMTTTMKMMMMTTMKMMIMMIFFLFPIFTDSTPSQNKGIDSLYALFVIPIVCGLIVIILYR